MNRRSFLKFLAAAAAVPTLPAIGQVVEPDLDAFGCWLGLETLERPKWQRGEPREIFGRGYERLFIPSREWRPLGHPEGKAVCWDRGHTFIAASDWGLVDLLTLFRRGKPVWRVELSSGPYRIMNGDCLRIEELRMWEHGFPGGEQAIDWITGQTATVSLWQSTTALNRFLCG